MKEEEPELAVAEYRKFLDSYPDHQYASYAQYQIAMVYFNQIESPERGYGGAAKALEEFGKLRTMFPRNPYKEAVDIKIEKCRNTIADYEYLVGEFYYKKGSYQAALGRFEGLLKKYPGYQGESAVLFYPVCHIRTLARQTVPLSIYRSLLRNIRHINSYSKNRRENPQERSDNCTRPSCTHHEKIAVCTGDFLSAICF